MGNKHYVEGFEQYRVLLFSIAYRMTGSASDAEDLVQEAYLRYQASEGEEIVSRKSYLTTIITNLALDYLKSARVTREEYVGTWLPEPILTTEDGTSLEQKETISLAFLRVVETLTPPERAVFLLHEAFDYPFNEIGAMLQKSTANCRQIFHRAKQALSDKRTRFDLEPQRQHQLLLSFLSASQAGNVSALTELLAQDAIAWADGGGKVPSILNPIFGQMAVARLFVALLSTNREAFSASPVEINGNPALLVWESGRLVVVLSLTLSNGKIQEIYGLLNPEKLTYLQKQIAECRATLEIVKLTDILSQ